MKSTLSLQAGQLTEHLGLARLWFDLEESGSKLNMRLTRLTFLGIPCPGWALPAIIAHESGEGDQLHFSVRASVPLIGRVAGYEGYLVLPAPPGHQKT
jgi:hypothetical protein